MDHPHHAWSPITTRGKLSWPNNAKIALCVIITLEHTEWEQPEGSYSADQAGGLGVRPFPDYPRFSHREYGHRVGIFRVLDTLERLGIKATVAMDTQTAEGYPFLVKHCQDRGCEIIAHGVSGSQMITGNMSVEEETVFIRSSRDKMQAATGNVPRGWHGTDYGESNRTPDLLRQAGFDYVTDWVNDEQPYPMRDGLTALPTMLEMDDLFTLSQRRVTIDRFAQSVTDAFDTMYRESDTSGRLLTMNLHPWLIGQPFRIGYLEEALRHIMGHDGVWAATGSEIVDWFNNNPPA
jgi:peptidoglycan/xylan/chitin deacetylase (PgdA/CDA1 family)